MRTGIVYCRESRDDGGERYERIETQRDILIRFCEKNGITPIHVVLDDNVSGSGFSRMLKVRRWIETEKVDVLVAKDASRIGRNQLESLEFIRFLEAHRVELLLESERYDETLFGLFAWLNERRAKEDGAKIRRVLRHKMEQGELLIKPTYGYRIVNKELQVYPNEAANVCYVFERFSAGSGMSEIASTLQRRFPHENWSCQKVSRMLRNPIYRGTYQVGKTAVSGYGSKRTEKRPESDWLTIDNHHPAIVSFELFDAALNRLGEKRRVAEHKYAGLLFCADCGAKMTRRIRHQNQAFFVCSSYNRGGRTVCTSHKISEVDLDRNILSAIFKLYQCRDGFWQKKSVCREAEEQKEQLQIRLKRLETQLERIYEDRLLDGFPRALFEKKLKEYVEQKELLTAELLRLSEEHHLEVPREIKLTKEALRTIADRIEIQADGAIHLLKN